MRCICCGRRYPSAVVAVAILCSFVSVLNLQGSGHTLCSSFRFLSSIKLDTTTDLPAAQLGRKVSKRIDLSSCPEHRLVVAPGISHGVGIGHRMTEAFFIFHYAVIRGYCFCFETDHFGENIEVYHLLFKPLFPPCQTSFPNRTLKASYSLEAFENQFISTLTEDDKAIQWIFPTMREVWPVEIQRNRPVDGYGDVLAFFDSFLRDNHIVEEVLIPWYRQHKSFNGTAFRTGDDATNIDVQENHVDQVVGRNDNGDVSSIVLNATFHVRVGDIVLMASETYWRNVLMAMTSIVELEFGPGRKVHIYWAYFQAIHNVKEEATKMRDRLAQDAVGEWPSEPDMLPPSHLFIAKLCEEFDRFECFWKLGTNMLETIDLFVNSDIVYVSGSSFPQVLSLFNRGVRLVALTKEVSFSENPKGSIYFLTTSTNAFNSLQHYYIDGTGELFDEQLAYLGLNPPNRTAI